MLLSRKNGLVMIIASLLIAGCGTKTPFSLEKERPLEQCRADAAQLAAAAQRAQLQDMDDMFAKGALNDYVVKKGDTLWDISKRFLRSPWYWKRIWHSNPHIKNPNLIYPGDRLGIVMVNGHKRLTITQANNRYHGTFTGRYTKNGLPIVSYEPTQNAPGMPGAAPSINGSLIAPFVLKTRIVRPEVLAQAPHVFGDGRDYLTLTMEQYFFTKGIHPQKHQRFAIYRMGDAVIDPSIASLAQTDEEKARAMLGYQMRYIGEAEAIHYDASSGLTKLAPTNVVHTIQENDVLLPVESDNLNDMIFFPRLPDSYCTSGAILSNMQTDALNISGYVSIVTSFGKEDGAQVGDVWKIQQPPVVRKINGEQVTIPGEDVGYVMIYKVYDQYSLAFVLESTQNIKYNYLLVRP